MDQGSFSVIIHESLLIQMEIIVGTIKSLQLHFTIKFYYLSSLSIFIIIYPQNSQYIWITLRKNPDTPGFKEMGIKKSLFTGSKCNSDEVGLWIGEGTKWVGPMNNTKAIIITHMSVSRLQAN